MASGRKYEMKFFTATILEWKYLLTNDLYKDIITGSMKFFADNNRVQLYTFAIMNNHRHLLWDIIHPNKREDIQRDFLRFTSHMIVKDLKKNNPELLNVFYVGAKDREYQVGERNPLSVPVWSEEVLKQKLNYIHNNPVKTGLCHYAEDYKYSSAAIYHGLASEWDFVTLCVF